MIGHKFWGCSLGHQMEKSSLLQNINSTRSKEICAQYSPHAATIQRLKQGKRCFGGEWILLRVILLSLDFFIRYVLLFFLFNVINSLCSKESENSSITKPFLFVQEIPLQENIGTSVNRFDAFWSEYTYWYTGKCTCYQFNLNICCMESIQG